MNQPKSALSAKMHTEEPTTEVKALAATEEPLEVMMRRIITEFKNKSTDTNTLLPARARCLQKRAPRSLIALVQFIEGQRLCDLSVVTVVQDDIRSLDPINTFTTFADAVDNMIAINLLQEELLMMGQPYSDSSTPTRCPTQRTSGH